MDKPLYILIFLLLWSTRIRGGEEEDINGTLFPSTQKTGVRNSFIDKASTSSTTKIATIFDPDSDTLDPISSKSVTRKTAKESTRKNTTTLSDTDSDSSETKSPSNKPEVPQTTNDSSETNSPPITSEETENKPDAPEIFLPNSVTIKPARDSIAVNTTESDPDSEPPETDSTSIKSEAPETEFGTQQPSFHNFESHELADEPSETNAPLFISEAPEINPASTAKAKTATISDPNSDNPEPSFINLEIHIPSKESTTLTKIISDSESESSEVKSTFLKSKTSKTTTVDLRRVPRSSDEERDLKERRNTNTVSAEMGNPRSTRDIKRRISKSKVGKNATDLSVFDTCSKMDLTHIFGQRIEIFMGFFSRGLMQNKNLESGQK